MFGRHNGLFVVAAYAIVLLVVGVSARLAFVYYQAGSSTPIAMESDSGNQRLVANGAPATKAIHYDYTAVAAANERLATLQSNLERTSNQLQEKSRQLNQRNAECRALFIPHISLASCSRRLLAWQDRVSLLRRFGL